MAVETLAMLNDLLVTRGIPPTHLPAGGFWQGPDAAEVSERQMAISGE